jgi:hypothetical protein
LNSALSAPQSGQREGSSWTADRAEGLDHLARCFEPHCRTSRVVNGGYASGSCRGCPVSKALVQSGSATPRPDSSSSMSMVKSPTRCSRHACKDCSRLIGDQLSVALSWSILKAFGVNLMRGSGGRAVLANTSPIRRSWHGSRSTGRSKQSSSLRARAEEILAKAETYCDEDSRETMRGVAASYEKLAQQGRNGVRRGRRGVACDDAVRSATGTRERFASTRRRSLDPSRDVP